MTYEFDGKKYQKASAHRKEWGAEKDKAAFREYVIERMIDDTLQDDGRYFETFRRIKVFARK